MTEPQPRLFRAKMQPRMPVKFSRSQRPNNLNGSARNFPVDGLYKWKSALHRGHTTNRFSTPPSTAWAQSLPPSRSEYPGVPCQGPQLCLSLPAFGGVAEHLGRLAETPESSTNRDCPARDAHSHATESASGPIPALSPSPATPDICAIRQAL